MIAIRSQKYRAVAEVVGDVKIGEAEIALQVTHQLEHLRPHAHVQHRDGLVGDDELRPEDDRPARNRALLLATRKSLGYLYRNRSTGTRPTLSRARETRRRTSSSPFATWWIRSGWPTASRIVIAGLSEACGSWKMSWSRLRAAGSAARKAPRSSLR